MPLESPQTQQRPQRPRALGMAAVPTPPAVEPVRGEWWWSTRLLLSQIDRLLLAESR